MNKLLHSGFYRLRKNKIYAGGLAGVLLYCVIVCVAQYMNKIKYGYEISAELVIFNFLPLIGVVLSVFASLFVGTEYSDGTIRNKLIVGMPRTQIYLANLFISMAGSILIVVSAYVIGMALSIPFFGAPEMAIPQLAIRMLNGICLSIAYISVFHMLTMINSSKTNAAVMCILGAFALIIIAIFIFSRLSQPELIPSMVIKDGENVMGTVKNPNYLTGIKRDIYQHILDLLPSGQAMQIVNQEPVNSLRWFLYSGLITLVSNIIGIGLFRRKDIK